jgi:hypothetical protein
MKKCKKWKIYKLNTWIDRVKKDDLFWQYKQNASFTPFETNSKKLSHVINQLNY